MSNIKNVFGWLMFLGVCIERRDKEEIRRDHMVEKTGSNIPCKQRCFSKGE